MRRCEFLTRLGATPAASPLAVRAQLSLFCLLLLTTLAVAAEIKTFKLATGEVLVHAFEKGIPLPSDSKWAIVTGAGPLFTPKGKETHISWSVFLKPKGAPAQLRDVARATVEEVSGKNAVTIFDGVPRDAETRLMMLSADEVVTRERFPWLYTAEPSMFVFRVILFKGKEQDKLLQPVLIGADIKKKLKDGGYLP
jgi:hypothetical protein